MSNRLTDEQIREYWTRQAIDHGQSVSASWSDRFVVEMEVRTLLSHVTDGMNVLDVGCANGYSTVRIASARDVSAVGIDYVPEMIREANERAARLEPGLRSRLRFEVGDARKLSAGDGMYDCAISTRVIINLGEWKQQELGLLECVRVVRSGGLFLLSEATLQGWNRLNAFRGEWGLPDIPMPSFNNYLDIERVEQCLDKAAELVEVVDFASTYYVGTRVLKPLLIEALNSAVDAANPDMEWNRWFSNAPAWGDYGTQKLLVFRKR